MLDKTTDEILTDAFEQAGGCGHDLGLEPLVSLIEKWEEIRTPERLEELRNDLKKFLD